MKQEKKTKTSKWTHFSNRCKMAGEQQALEKKGYIVDSPFVPRRKDHVNVYVRISIVRIGDIDTVRQEFQCEIYMRLRWTEEKFKHMDNSEKNRTTWESMWDPRHFFNNATKLDENETVKEFRDPQVVYHCYVTGIFKEVFTINNFPFDYQKLSLLLSAKCLADQVTFLKDPEKRTTFVQRTSSHLKSGTYALTCLRSLRNRKRRQVLLQTAILNTKYE